MSNISMHSSVKQNSSVNEQEDVDVAEQKVEEPGNKIQYLGMSEIAKSAKSLKAEHQEVKAEEHKPAPKANGELNGASGYYWGESHVPSKDSMSNLCNYSNWVRTVYGI